MNDPSDPLRDPAFYALLVFLYAIAGIVVIVALRMWRRFNLLCHGDYSRYSQTLWKTRPFDEYHLWCETQGGFRIAWRLRGYIERVDNDEFEKARMLENDSQRGLVHEFSNTVVRPTLLEDDHWVFRYGWLGDGATPGAVLYEKDEKHLKALFDANCARLVEAVNRRASQVGWKLWGCTIRVTAIEKVFNHDTVQDNFRSLPEQQVATIVTTPEYLRAQEQIAAVALKQRLDILKPFAVQRGHLATVAYAVIDQCVRMEWHLSSEAIARGLYIRGFRREGGFAVGQWAESVNGVLVADGRRSGTADDHPNPGQTHYYTFMVKSKYDETGGEECLRFSVRIPEQASLAPIERLLGKATKATDPNRERRNRLLDSINFNIETKQILVELKNKLNDAVKNDPKYSEVDRQDIATAIENEIEDVQIAMQGKSGATYDSAV